MEMMDEIKKIMASMSGIASCVAKKSDGKEIDLIGNGENLAEQHMTLMNVLLAEFVMTISKIAQDGGAMDKMNDPRFLIDSLRTYERLVDEEWHEGINVICDAIAAEAGLKGGEAHQA